MDLYHPDTKYNIIYVDPPWKHSDNHHPNKSENSLPRMDIDDLEMLPVIDLAADDCVLFLWAVFPLLQDALDVMSAWGFQYKTVGFTWVKHCKQRVDWFLGVGNYTRSNAEICLIGTRGRLKRVDAGVCSVVDTPLLEHSIKPDIIRNQIVRLYGDVPRVELFAKKQVRGWDSWTPE